MERKPNARCVSMPPTERKVMFQRQVSAETVVPLSNKKALTRANTVVGQVTFSKQLNRPTTTSSVMDELVECPVCTERLTCPKMLPCQHTFCSTCLEAIAKGKLITCPLCKLAVALTNNVSELPTNLYLNSLLTALAQASAEDKTISASSEGADNRCIKCQTVVQGPTCQHCKQMFCFVCWPSHVAELREQLGSLTEQLQGAAERLKHRGQDFKDQCEKLHEHIEEAVELKIARLREKQAKLTNEAKEIELHGEESANQLQAKLLTAESNISFLTFDNVTEDAEKVNLFLLLHRTTSDLLNEVSHWSEVRPSFDRDSFRIHHTEEGEGEVDDDGEEGEVPEVKRQVEQATSPDGVSLHYRSRNFHSPRLNVGRSTLQRPAGVGVAPWNPASIYIAGTDNHQVLVIDRTKGRLTARINAPEMSCPQGVAFSATRLYVTDKWNHLVHVFSSDGIYLRGFGKKGTADGQLRSPEGICTGLNPYVLENTGEDENLYLYICDTGNDRIQVLRANDGSFVKYIGLVGKTAGGKHLTELNQPTGISVTDSKIVVTDCGNRRIKVYSLSGVKTLEFGSHGGGRGQFRSPECIAVDRMGFILVGDSGNARIQIFRPNGNLVRTIGGRSSTAWKFGWISGLAVTENMEIIVTDSKNHCVQIF